MLCNSATPTIFNAFTSPIKQMNPAAFLGLNLPSVYPTAKSTISHSAIQQNINLGKYHVALTNSFLPVGLNTLLLSGIGL